MNKLGAILIIEDDADVLRAARIALSQHAEQIETRLNLNDLEQTLTVHNFDLVLLDMNFMLGEHSGREGLTALQKIRTVDPALAVVLMTAYGGLALAVEALKQGATDFILKPWRNDKLLAAVTAAAKLTHERRLAQDLDLDKLERSAIEKALVRHDGNISLAASALGLSRAALYRRLSKHGL